MDIKFRFMIAVGLASIIYTTTTLYVRTLSEPMTLGLLFFTVLSFWVIGIILEYSITAPIKKLTKDLNEIRAGNLSRHIEIKTDDEIEDLADSVKGILVSMKLAIMRTGVSKEDVGIGKIIEAKEKAEEKYKNIFENAIDPIVVLDEKGIIIDVNHRVLEETGYSKDFFIGKYFANLGIIDVSSLPITLQRYADIYRGKKIIPFEMKVIKKDGSIFVGEVNAASIYSDSKIIGSVNIIRDIKERKITIEKLRENEEKFKGFFENSEIGMTIVSPEGKFVEVNNSLCKMLQYSKDELTKKTFQEITHKDDLEEDLNNVKNMINGKISNYSMDKRYIKKDGKIIWITLTVSMVKDKNGKPLYFVSQIQEIKKITG